MRRIALDVLLLAGLFVSIPAFAAEPLVVELWPGKTPGDVGIKGEETSKIRQSPLVGPTKIITNVTKPTLTVYQANWETNTGTAMVICPGGGYWDLYWELEGEEVAAWLNSHGMTGIILKYRCPRRPGDVPGEPPLGPQMDAQRAVSLVRAGPRNGASIPRVSASSASRRAVISHWPPPRILRNGRMNRSTRWTRSVAGPISPSCAIQAI